VIKRDFLAKSALKEVMGESGKSIAWKKYFLWMQQVRREGSLLNRKVSESTVEIAEVLFSLIILAKKKKTINCNLRTKSVHVIK